jgi:hypothetical protein
MVDVSMDTRCNRFRLGPVVKCGARCAAMTTNPEGNVFRHQSSHKLLSILLGFRFDIIHNIQ